MVSKVQVLNDVKCFGILEAESYMCSLRSTKVPYDGDGCKRRLLEPYLVSTTTRWALSPSEN
ncbi:hypothetical protein QQP08_024516 [Theobroma cacao]|nr:hypothetical protein QQP08_024516 [Theobroma cacao]